MIGRRRSADTPVRGRRKQRKDETTAVELKAKARARRHSSTESQTSPLTRMTLRHLEKVEVVVPLDTMVDHDNDEQTNICQKEEKKEGYQIEEAEMELFDLVVDDRSRVNALAHQCFLLDVKASLENEPESVSTHVILELLRERRKYVRECMKVEGELVPTMSL